MTERLTILVEERGTRVVRRRFRDLGDGARRAGDDVDFLGTALRGLAAAGAVAVLTAATTAAVGFADALAEVSTLLTGDNISQEIDRINDSALELSRTYGGTAVGQARAFYQAISAGAADAAEATEILTVANQLAVGGVTDVFTATDGLTTVLNAYGDAVAGAADVSDTLFVGVRAGKTTIEELSSTLGRVAPLAAQVGVDFDQLVAATAALTKGGISTAESVTGLRAVLAAVSKPSSEAADLAEQLGIEFNVAGLQAQGLEGFLQSLTRATGGNTEALAQLFGGVEALVPILALTGTGAADFANILGDMEERAGSTEEAFTRMANSPGFQLGRVVDALTAELIELGQVVLPLVTAAAKFLADNMSLLFDILQVVAISFAVNRALAFSTALFTMARGAAQLQAALGGTSVAMGLFNAIIARTRLAVNGLTLAIAANPIGLLVVAVTTAIVLLFKFRDAIRISSEGLATLGDLGRATFEALRSGASAAFNAVKDTGQAAFETITPLLQSFAQSFQNTFPKLSALAINVWNAIDFSFRGLVTGLAKGIDFIAGSFVGGFAAAQAAGQNAAAGIEGFIVNAINSIGQKFNSFINGIISGLNSIGGLVGIDPIAERTFEGLEPRLQGAGQSAAEAFASGINGTTFAQDAVSGIFDRAEEIAQTRAEELLMSQQVVTPGSGGTIPTDNGGNPVIPTGGSSGSGSGSGSRAAANAELSRENELLKEQTNILEEIRQPLADLQLRKEALGNLFESGQISADEFNRAMRDLNVEITALDNSISGGLLNGLARIAQEANNIGQQMSDFVVGAFNSATDAIVEFAKTGQFNVRQFFQDLFAQLLKLAANQLFSQLLGGLFGGGGGLGGAGGLLGGLLGFQNGGSAMVAGNNNSPDSQLVAFRATRGERVDVSTPGQQRQGGVGAQGGTTVVQSPPVNVVAQIGNSDVTNAFDNPEGEQVLINMMQRNASTVKQIAQS